MNWGTKLIIGMAVFMAFIVGMGTKMILSDTDSLVEKDYYEKGLSYSNEYDRQVNAAKDGVIPSIEADSDGLSVAFIAPAEFEIECKNTSDSKLDRVFKGSTDEDNTVTFGRDELPEGRWRVKINFASNSKEYQFAQEVVIP